jgi:hypothetical protein
MNMMIPELVVFDLDACFWDRESTLPVNKQGLLYGVRTKGCGSDLGVDSHHCSFVAPSQSV